MTLRIRDELVFVDSARNEQRIQLIGEATSALLARRVSASRLAVGPDFIEDLQSRQPIIVVLDYLLDAYGTAVDLLRAGSLPKDSKIFIWTDEPSVEVAVTLMKLGAVEYLLTTQKRSVEKLVIAAEALISTTRTEPVEKPQKTPFIARSEAMQQAEVAAEALALSDGGIGVLAGPSGSGRNTFARRITELRPRPTHLVEIDWDLFEQNEDADRTVQKFCALLSADSTVIIDHLDIDSGELLQHFLGRDSWLRQRKILILLGLRTQQSLRLVLRLLPEILVCVIPKLNERLEDCMPLIKSGMAETHWKRIPFSVELVKRISALPWPGNVRQLIAASRDAFYSSQRDIFDDKEAAEEIYFNALQQAHDRWIRIYNFDVSVKPSPQAIYRAYCKSGCSTGLTAAALNVDVQYVSRILSRLFTRSNSVSRGVSND